MTPRRGPEVTFAFSPPVRDLSWKALDTDWGTWEDYVRVRGLSSTGGEVPHNIVTDGAPAYQIAGDIIEGDSGAASNRDLRQRGLGLRRRGRIRPHASTGRATTSPIRCSSSSASATPCSAPSTSATRRRATAPAPRTGARHVLGSRSIYLGSTPPDGEVTDPSGTRHHGRHHRRSAASTTRTACAELPRLGRELQLHRHRERDQPVGLGGVPGRLHRLEPRRRLRRRRRALRHRDRAQQQPRRPASTSPGATSPPTPAAPRRPTPASASRPVASDGRVAHRPGSRAARSRTTRSPPTPCRSPSPGSRSAAATAP